MPPEYVVPFIPVAILGSIPTMAAIWWAGGKVRKVLAALRRGWALVRRIALDWVGEPGDDGHEARPGVMARLRSYDGKIDGMTEGLREVKEVQEEHSKTLGDVAALSTAVAEVRRNVKPNSGTSSHDAIMGAFDELRKLVVENIRETASITTRVSDLDAAFTAALEANHPDYEPDLRADRNID